jgi:hypothetical protein
VRLGVPEEFFVVRAGEWAHGKDQWHGTGLPHGKGAMHGYDAARHRLFHGNGLPHGKGYLHDKEKAARQLYVARQRLCAHGSVSPHGKGLHARQRYGRMAKPLPCNIGEPHGK